jgi:hypothetical protein
VIKTLAELRLTVATWSPSSSGPAHSPVPVDTLQLGRIRQDQQQAVTLDLGFRRSNLHNGR